MDGASQYPQDPACAAAPDDLPGLLKAHAQAIRAVIEPRIPDRWRSLLSCDDVLQQTFLDAFLSAGSFVPTGDDSFLRWLRRLAENNLIEAIRALEADKRGGRARRVTAGRTSRPSDPCTTLVEQLVSPHTQTTPSRAVSQRETAAMLQAAMALLPPDYRKVVQRYDLDGRNIADVAAELGRSPGAVHLLRVRAHKRLRDLLAEKFTHS